MPEPQDPRLPVRIPAARTDPGLLLAGRARQDARAVMGLAGEPRPRPLSDPNVPILRAEWRKHRDNPATGRCPICGVSECLEWRVADSLLRMCGDDPEGGDPR